MGRTLRMAAVLPAWRRRRGCTYGQGCSARLAAVGAGERGTWGVGAVVHALPRLLRGWGDAPAARQTGRPGPVQADRRRRRGHPGDRGRAADRGPAAVADPEGPVGAACSVLGGCGG